MLDKPELNLYLELEDGQNNTSQEISVLIHEELRKLDSPYSELESMTGLRPIKVTLLAKNAFRAYQLKQRASGAGFQQLRPPRINPSDEIIDFLFNSVLKELSSKKPR